MGPGLSMVHFSKAKLSTTNLENIHEPLLIYSNGCVLSGCKEGCARMVQMLARWHCSYTTITEYTNAGGETTGTELHIRANCEPKRHFALMGVRKKLGCGLHS